MHSPLLPKKRPYHKPIAKKIYPSQINLILVRFATLCNLELLKIVILLVIQNVLVLLVSFGMFIIANHIVLKRDAPPLTGAQSSLNLQPGLSMLPRPDSLTSLIRFRMARRQSYGPYVHDLLGFVQGYERHTQGSRLSDCKRFVSYSDHPKFSCKFSLDLGSKSCNLYNSFGFDNGSPCIVLKLNKIFGWIPDLSPNSNNITVLGFPTIKIKCEGVTDFDKESIGKICYYDEEDTVRYQTNPHHDADCQSDFGQIRNYYFPYKKQRSYQNPFIWVKLYELKRHVTIMIHCWVIANNIFVDFNEGLGSVQFEIIMD